MGVAEWAYGVTDWFEQGLYLPLYSFSPNDGATYNGFKLRWLFVKPHADDRKFFYGVNFEFSVNRPQWDTRHYTSEVRPIVGWHLKPIDIIVNPIVDTSYTGGFKSLEFVPAVRVAYNFSPKWAGAIEEYADYGPLRQILLGARAVAPNLGGGESLRQGDQYRDGYRVRADQRIRQSDAEVHDLARSELTLPWGQCEDERDRNCSAARSQSSCGRSFRTTSGLPECVGQRGDFVMPEGYDAMSGRRLRHLVRPFGVLEGLPGMLVSS